MEHAVGIIADIIGSSDMLDRPAAQRVITEAFEQVEAVVPSRRPAWATGGADVPISTATWQDAARITVGMQAMLAEEAELRVGIGAGEINTIEEGEVGPIQDGSAWLHARAAIEDVEQRQQHRAD